jgi:hypothetical protein
MGWIAEGCLGDAMEDRNNNDETSSDVIDYAYARGVFIRLLNRRALVRIFTSAIEAAAEGDKQARDFCMSMIEGRGDRDSMLRMGKIIFEKSNEAGHDIGSGAEEDE